MLNKDYRGVKYQVWCLLKKIYGSCSSEVVRDSLDIYSEDRSEEMRYLQILNKQASSEEHKQKDHPLKRGATTLVAKESGLSQSHDNTNHVRSSSQASAKQNMLSQQLFAKAGVVSTNRRNKRNESSDPR